MEWGKTETIDVDVLILGGGIAGSWAAIAAAKAGARVALIEKSAVKNAGAAGSGVDHWEAAATNPCSRISPEELADAYIRSHYGYNNGVSHYVECREGWDRAVDIEAMGAKIRDTEDEFVGAEFRDDKTKLMFAYDYHNRVTIRVWGTTFKPALARELKRLKVRMFERTMVTELLSQMVNGEKRVAGAVAVSNRTGRMTVCRAKAVVICTSRPARVWLFSAENPGISEFRPPQPIGDGHAMAWRIGAALTMMEKSVAGEWSGLRSFPPYGTGNNHNTWYACTMVDANGREIPYADRDGRILKTVSERYYPAPGQRLFIKGGSEPEYPYYEFQGPETLSVEELLRQGYQLPFYADLSRMPEMERRVIWGMMVGQEGKTRIPIMKTYTELGFDPQKHQLQSYGTGWQSANFLPQERQLFGLPGGLLNDWRLMTTVPGLFVAGDSLFASDGCGHASATGHYAGRWAAAYAKTAPKPVLDQAQIAAESKRLDAILKRRNGVLWPQLNSAICRAMQSYCGAVRTDSLMKTGLQVLGRLRENEAENLMASNPHELERALEVQSILTVAGIITHACMARKASSRELHFDRVDYPQMDPPEWNKFITVALQDGQVKLGELPLDYYGDVRAEYERLNGEYIRQHAKPEGRSHLAVKD